MSGYSSKAEVMAVVKDTITSDHNRTGLSTNPADYNLAAIVRENFHSRGAGYGWGASTDQDGFVASLRRNLRTRVRIAETETPAEEATPDELAPGMYRVRITVTNRDGVHTATEDMNPAAIELARSRPGWSVEILGESRVTTVEDDEQDTAAKAERSATAHTPRKIGPKHWAIECTWGCGNTITTTRKPPVMLGCSRPDCHAAHNAGVTARQVEKAARPRTPRVRREIPASDWSMLVAFNRARSARVETDPRTVTGTPENIDARATARARGELAAQAPLTFDESDRQAMTVAQLRATAGDALALF